VTNFYQGFGLSFVAVLSQDVPSVRFYPQSAQSLVDIAAARAASDVSELVERNNHVEHLLTSIGYFCGRMEAGAYVRYVKMGSGSGFARGILAAVEIPLGRMCGLPECGKETPAGGGYQQSDVSDQEAGEEGSLDSGLQKAQTSAGDDNWTGHEQRGWGHGRRRSESERSQFG